MIHPQQLREHIIRPTLKRIALYSRSAEELLMMTAAQESELGSFAKQWPTGPALGIFQMEPATHDDCWTNYLAYMPSLAGTIREMGQEAAHLIARLDYATAMARIKYVRDPHQLPQADDIEGMARYWKRVYNTPEGKGQVYEAVASYRHLVLKENA